VGELWQDEGFGSVGSEEDELVVDDWDEGEESLETTLEDDFDDPDELDEDWEEAEDDERLSGSRTRRALRRSPR
jgi:hypothetical protein